MDKSFRLKNIKSPAIYFIFIITIFLLIFVSVREQTLDDENQFYDAIKLYSSGEYTLISNDLPMTPLYLFVFGNLHKIFGLNLIQLRYINIILFFIISLLLLAKAKEQKSFYKAMIIILVTPYFMFVCVSAYTDLLCILMLLLGFIFYEKDKLVLSSLFFILAIATRQYAVVFPAALAIIVPIKSKRFLYMFLACSTLIIWFILFGFSFSPPLNTENKVGFNLLTGLLFLATYGIYYILPRQIINNNLWNNKKNRMFWFVSGCIFILTLFCLGIKDYYILSQYHPFYWLLFTGFGIIVIPFASAYTIINIDKKFEAILVLLSFIMFCFIDNYFDKYIIVYSVIMSYLLMNDRFINYKYLK